MEDEELNLLRAKRLAELQQKSLNSQNTQAQDEERRAKEEEFKNNILSQVLSQEARSRLSTICIAKPENGKLLENMVINMARSGQIRTKLDDKEFIGLLEQVNEKMQMRPVVKVKFDRRRANMDSDEDF